MIFIQSRIGGRQENQDFYGHAKTKFGNLIVVCDGMGGYKRGKFAAELAVNTIINKMNKTPENDATIALKNAIVEANNAIWQEAQKIGFENMGTTVAILLLKAEKAISCHVGDSRIYQIRNNEIIFRTCDHSHVFELVKAGILSEEEARVSKKSNIITRALGIQDNVTIDTTDNLVYKSGDLFLICTDGIWGMLPEMELINMICQKNDISYLLNNLMEKIDELGIESGGKHDNLTASLIKIEKLKHINKNKLSEYIFSFFKKIFTKKKINKHENI